MSDDPIGDLLDRQEIEEAELHLRHDREYVELISAMDWPEPGLSSWHARLKASERRLEFLRQRQRDRDAND